MRTRFVSKELTLGRLLLAAAVVLAVSLTQAAPPKKTDGKPASGGPAPVEPQTGVKPQSGDTPQIDPQNGVDPGAKARPGGKPRLSGAVAAPGTKTGGSGQRVLSGKSAGNSAGPLSAAKRVASGRVGSAVNGNTISVDPCAFAGAEKLKSLLAPYVGVLKFEYHKDGRHLTMSDPALSDLKCPGCKIEIKAKVRYQNTRGFPQFSASGTMRASARLEARVTMDGPQLQRAQVLVKDLKVIGLNLSGVNNAIDAEIRKQMDQRLPNQLPPIDVTALVQAFLNQGGSFAAASSPARAAGSLKGGGNALLRGSASADGNAQAGAGAANLPGEVVANLPASQVKIASISKNSGQVTAADPVNGRVVEFQVSDPSVLKALNLGQRVWLEEGRPLPAGAERANQLVAKVVKFPIEKDQENNVATGHMKTAVKLSNTGIVSGTTRTWTNNEIQGFTGGVKVELQDRDGNVLRWDMPVQTYGVNAKALTASAPSSRTADWRFDVPVEIVNQTARIRIMHRHTPQGRLDEFVDIAWKLGKLAEFYVGLAKDVGAVASGGPGTGGPPQGGTGPTEPTP